MTAAVDVSVIIPTHKRRQLLLRLLDSLARQNLGDLKIEVIVVHNYTDDGSREAIAQWQQQHCQLELHYFKKNYPGPAASRQFGAEQAKGEILAFIDDDCIATENWIRAGSAPFAESDIGLVQGRTRPNPGQPRRFLEKTVNIEQKSVFYETCNIFYRRSAFFAIGGFSPKFINLFYGEDTDLGWKLHKSDHREVFAENALVYHEVFQVGLWQWLREPLFFVNLPLLTKVHPELRAHMYRRYFISRQSALFNLLLLALGLGLLNPWLLTLGLPYFIERYQSGSHMPNPGARLLRIAAGIPRAAITWFALIKGSIRHRGLLF